MQRLTYLVTVEADGRMGSENLPEAYAGAVCVRVVSEALAGTQGVGQYTIQGVDGGVTMKERRGFVHEPLVALIEGAVGTVRDWEGHIAAHVHTMHEALRSLGYTPKQLDRNAARGR